MAYIGNPPVSGNFQVCDAISVVNGQAAYTMQVGSANVSPESASHMLVSVNGILQKRNSSFTISGSTITFASNLATGDVIDFILLLGNVNDIGTPSDDTVATAKIQDDAVTKAKVNFISDGTAGVEVKGDGGSNDGYIQLNCSQNSHGIKLKSPAHSTSSSYTLTFPGTDPVADKFLKTDGSGNLSFDDAGGGILVGMKWDSDISPSGTTTTTSNSYQDTGVAFTYTPAATTSKVWWNFNYDGYMAPATGYWKIIRTVGGSDTDVYAQAVNNISRDSSWDPRWDTWYEDSPNTTSEITYKLYIRGSHPNAFSFEVASFFIMETSS